MKTMLKFFLIALLPVAAAVTSCQDADDWKPTWALPIVKDQILRIGDFITDEEVKEINDQVRAEWKGYVNERFSSSDSIGIDSVAYTALTKKDSTYVDFDAQGVPTLNDSTKTLIKENLKTKGESSDVIEAKIDQINDFLKVYHSALELKAQQQSINPSSKARAKPRAEPSGGGEKYYGGDTVVNNLLDAMIHPTDVFVTAANLLSAMGESYFDSINNQIDSVLAKANMQDTIALDLAEYIGADASIAALVVGLDINSTLPFEVKLKASFVDVESSIIDTVFNKEKKISHTKEFTKTELDGIAKSKEGVMLGVKCEKKETITEAILRNLSQQTVSFSLRVKVQAPMNKLDF